MRSDGDLFWPGAERAGDHLSDAALVAAMVTVEQAWLAVGPAGRDVDLTALVKPDDLPALARDAESGGNPVIPLVALLRERLGGDVAPWLHAGLTSQDVLDTAIVIAARDAVAQVRSSLGAQATLLTTLAETHRETPMVARTLTQHAVPTTFGLTVVTWLAGVLDAIEAVDVLAFPVQAGGAAGTLAAVVELGGDLRQVDALAERLGLDASPPWHTRRTPVTRIGDAAVTCTDAWGHLANDVLTLGRPEIGELREGTTGGSSTMPNKANPVLSLLVRRAALAAPPLAATLHLAAAGQVDQRADGAWHVEWATLRTLLRRTLVAGSQVKDLLAGLDVDTARMAATFDAARADATSEQRAMAGLAGHEFTGDYLGAAAALVDVVIDRTRHLEEHE